jgi:hypothetical protein
VTYNKTPELACKKPSTITWKISVSSFRNITYKLLIGWRRTGAFRANSVT